MRFFTIGNGKFTFFCDVKSCTLADRYNCFHLEDGCSGFHQNVGTRAPNYTVS